MKCPFCFDLELTSRVTSEDFAPETEVGYLPYYDDEDVYHSHDPNRRGTRNFCTQGHVWYVTDIPKCPAGDYPVE